MNLKFSGSPGVGQINRAAKGFPAQKTAGAKAWWVERKQRERGIAPPLSF